MPGRWNCAGIEKAGMRRQEAEQRGRRGENFAAWWLRLHGWRIIGQRIKTPRGEINLIARRMGVVAFIEVKWRRTAEQLYQSIDEYRLRRVAAAVEAVAHKFMREGDTARIDVMLLAPKHLPRHITNAWQP
jgi:putative endonuclease